MRNSLENTGFAPPAAHHLGGERHTVAFAELITSVALALCTILVATVVSVGIADAGVADGIINHEGSVFGIALLLGLLFIGLGGLSVMSGEKPNRR